MPQTGPAGWRDKLHPIFLELAALNRSFEEEHRHITEECERALRELGENPPAEPRAAIVRRLEQRCHELLIRVAEQLQDINDRHGTVPYNPVAHSYLYGPTGERGDDALTLARYLHWHRHGESLDVTAERDRHGDLEAWESISRTATDFRRVVHRKGPIKPFQRDIVHRQLLETILCFEREPLTAEELAECLDEYCACGHTHDADAVRKQYARLKKELGT